MCQRGHPFETPASYGRLDNRSGRQPAHRDALKEATVARPKKNQDGLTAQFGFRLTEDEAKVLREKIAKSGMNQADFLRQVVVANKTSIVSRSPLEKQRLLFLFNKTSNNVNQIAHVFNSANVSGKLTDAVYRDGLASLRGIAKYLKAALHYVDPD